MADKNDGISYIAMILGILSGMGCNYFLSTKWGFTRQTQENDGLQGIKEIRKK